MRSYLIASVRTEFDMSDLLAETLVPFYLAPAQIPGNPHISTLHRWRDKGLRGVKLETMLVGGRRFTSREALERFFSYTTAVSEGAKRPTKTPRQRRQDRDAAAKRLRDAGILQ